MASVLRFCGFALLRFFVSSFLRFCDSAVVSVDLCCAEPAFFCDPALQASVGGLYYPGWDCAAAIADAESNLSSWHYRNGCHQQVGSDLATPVDQASVAECHIEGDSAVVTVDLCCT